MEMTNLASIRVVAGVCHAQKPAFGVLDREVSVCEQEAGHELSSAADEERWKGIIDGPWNVILAKQREAMIQDGHSITAWKTRAPAARLRACHYREGHD